MAYNRKGERDLSDYLVGGEELHVKVLHDEVCRRSELVVPAELHRLLPW